MGKQSFILILLELLEPAMPEAPVTDINCHLHKPMFIMQSLFFFACLFVVTINNAF